MLPRLNRWWYGFIALVLVGAFFFDAFGYIYREWRQVTQHTAFWAPANPALMGQPISIHKGLDLVGGTEIVVAICQGPGIPAGSTCRSGLPKGVDLAKAQTDTVTILNQRVNGLGVSESKVVAQGSDQVLVQIPGLDVQKAIQVIGTTAKLHFATAVSGAPTPQNMASDQQNLYDPNQFANPNSYPSGFHWKFDDNLQASDVTSASNGVAQQTSQWVVDINFDSQGANEWSKITTAAFAQPQASPQNRVAIFLDNEVITAPDVLSPSSSQTQITGNFTQISSQQLAQQISAGALPAEISTVQASQVTATLGQQTIQDSLIAGIVGLLAVILFMVGYYRFPGLIASVALLCYAGIVLALVKIMPLLGVNITISLAGLAGFLLSVGMAVDANVLIFERIKEEVRAGRTASHAVELGFARAFPAIFDSNLSTSIASMVMLMFGSDIIAGFAVTLLMGVLVSFFTAITITQALFNIVLHFGWGRNPRLYARMKREDSVAKVVKGKFDIIKARNFYFLGSLAIIIPGILAILFWHFNLGIDFSGGNRLDVPLTHAATLAQVQQVVQQAAPDVSAQVQADGNNTFSIQTPPAFYDKVQAITDALTSKFGIDSTKVQFQEIGPSIATALVYKTIILVLVSSLLIALYLAYRFRQQKLISPWRFSSAVALKLLHDVFVLAGIWAIFGHFSQLGQVDSLFITAALTSVVFSLHDSIVVFDRIRENLRFGARLTFDQIVNLSTVQTLARSLNTTLTVVFVLLALVIFGGSTIRGFVLALLIGIVTGTYSSLFNASTLLVSWEKWSTSAKYLPKTPNRVQTKPA